MNAKLVNITLANGKVKKAEVMTPEIATDIITTQLAAHGLVTSAKIDKQAELDGSSYSIECGISWSTTVHIYLDIVKDYKDPDFRITTIDLETGDHKTYLKSKMHAGISWSSTTRDISAATACVELYQRAVKFAAAIETIVADFDYIEVQ